MGVRISIAFIGFFWSCCSQDLVPLLGRNEKVFHVVTYQEGMSLLGMLHSTSTSMDTFKRDNPTLTDSIVSGTLLYFRAQRKDLSHKVLSGDTPFGIAKRYAIPLDSLYSSNPLLNNNPLKVGQQIEVRRGVVRYSNSFFASPLTPDEDVKEPFPEMLYRGFSIEDSILIYPVRSGETITAIAKRFLTTSKKLKAYNRLTSNSLSAGMILKIPLVNDSISPAFGTIPAARQRIQGTPPKPSFRVPVARPLSQDKSWNIAVFLPLGGDTATIPLRGFSKNALDFYMGARLAIDSLNLRGCHGEVRFFDYWTERESVTNVLASGALKNCNLVVGPMHARESELLAKYCRTNNIPMVLQSASPSPEVQKNENVYSIATDMDRQLENLSSLAVKRLGSEQIILYTTKLPKDTSAENQFLTQFNQLNRGVKRIIIADAPTLKALLRSGRPSLVFSVTQEKEKAVEVVVMVKNSAATNKMVGLKEWTDWKEINSKMPNESDFYYFSTGCLDYTNASVKTVHKRFRSVYSTDFTKYAMFGYDVLLGFGSWLSPCGVDFPYHGLMMNFNYMKSENEYHSNYGLQLCRFRNFKSEKNASIDE